MNESGDFGSLPESLTTRQRRFLIALLSSVTVDAAAKSAGIGRTTAYSLMKEPTFAKTLRSLQDVQIRNVLGSLLATSPQAVATLSKVIGDTKANAGTRVRAADAVLGHILKIRDLIDIEDRVAAIEARLDASESGKRR